MKNECEREGRTSEGRFKIKNSQSSYCKNIVSKRQSRRSGGGHLKKKRETRRRNLKQAKHLLKSSYTKKLGFKKDADELIRMIKSKVCESMSSASDVEERKSRSRIWDLNGCCATEMY